EKVFYWYLAKAFGAKVNGLPFYMLAQQTPLNLLKKIKLNLFNIQAVLFGQAGFFMNEYKDDFPRRLKQEYQFQQKKLKITPIPFATWKFLRMRPVNFPSIRIAQFARLIHQSDNLFSKSLAAQNLKQYENMFELKLADYWKKHYVFDKESVNREKKLGKQSIHSILINTIAPFLFLYGKHRKEQQFVDKAIELLQAIPPEQNKITRTFTDLGFPIKSAFDSQAIIHLKRKFCDQRKCVYCKIGYQILQGAGLRDKNILER
ncbi:MAG: DUF2851 family protein, partial [Bacteroidota bacterium]